MGPFKEFRLKIDQKTNNIKGFGFCEYVDPDIAASALRNLNKLEVNSRSIKVDFASDNKSGTNLREDEVKFRDRGELVNLKGDYIDAFDTSTEEVLACMSIEQEQLLLLGLKDAYEQALLSGDTRATEGMVEALAHDEALLDQLMSMLERVQKIQGGPQYQA